jgi:transposase InsO family protein
MVVSTVPVAAGRDHRPAGDLDSLEPTRFPRLLALEVPPRRRPSSDCRRDSGADPAYEPREPTVRRTADHAELLMLGIEVAESTVSRYMVRRHRPPSQVWKTFLRNHAAGIASLDLFVVRTISFKLLDGLMILRHARRRLVTISVTTNPTAEWIAGQMTDAFPWDEAPRHLLRDRDAAFGPAYTRDIRAMRIRDHPTAPRSPWQNGYVERLIGSIRRESLDHLIVFDEAQLRRVLKNYASYDNHIRTHPSLDKNAPDFRRSQRLGPIVAIPILSGLHHHYVRA